MEPLDDGGIDGSRLLLTTRPLEYSRKFAREAGCDIAIPNATGIGNILMYSRVVEDMARARGRPLDILTAPLEPRVGTVSDEEPFPLWLHNPFIRRIVDVRALNPNWLTLINAEQDNLTQFNHMIENIAFHYGLRTRLLRPSLFLSEAEQSWALDCLSELRRPILCLHPYGTSSPEVGNPWYIENWLLLRESLNRKVSMFEVGKDDIDQKPLGFPRFRTTIRQMMALIWASDMFVGFDSSPAHIATAFERPALVLWDPIQKQRIEERWQTGFAMASLSRWSYRQNRNLLILGDRDDAILGMTTRWVDEQIALLRT